MYENEFMWNKGFEAGIAFTLRHDCTDIPRFITELARLRTWKTHEEWQDLVEKNIVQTEDEKTFPFYCEWCGKIKEGIGRKREIDITNFTVDVEPTPLTVEEIAEKVCQMGSNPHYICADCVRRELGKGKHA